MAVARQTLWLLRSGDVTSCRWHRPVRHSGCHAMLPACAVFAGSIALRQSFDVLYKVYLVHHGGGSGGGGGGVCLDLALYCACGHSA